MTNSRFTASSPETAAKVALGYHDETMSLAEAHRNAGFAGNHKGHGLRYWSRHDASMITLQWFGFAPLAAYRASEGIDR
jgi:hypothetical protein